LNIGNIVALTPLWLIFLGTMALNLICVQVGILLARYRIKRVGPENDSNISMTVGAMAGLLAFILTFTFGMTAGRFTDKNDLLLKEVNAIETTFLRAGLLPEPHRSEVRKLLKEHINLRVEPVESMEDVNERIKQSESLQGQMWLHAEALAAADLKNPDIVALFIESLNEMFRLQTDRVTISLIRRIPSSLWTMLLTLFVVTTVGLGYHFGISSSGKTHWMPAVILISLAFSCVFLLIADFDRETINKKMIYVNRQPMIELYQRIDGKMK